MSPARNDINQTIIPSFALKSGRRVLNVGVDRKWEYSQYFKEYWTMDIIPGLQPDIVGDIANCPQIPDNTFDSVILIGVYEAVHDKQAMFDEIYRILDDEGKALICVPGITYYPNDDMHFKLTDWHYLNKFYIERVHFSYYKTNLPYYYHFFLRK